MTTLPSISSVSEDKKENIKYAYFAGGCFWCTEHDLKHIHGVKDVISGYAGGDTLNPTYQDVCSGTTGHREAVMVQYNPDEICYKDLIQKFMKTIDPHDSGGQFFDRGSQYTNAVFYLNEDERVEALTCIKNAAEMLGVEKIYVSVLPFKNFFEAEIYHQGFSESNPDRYCSYRESSGRDTKLKIIWNFKN